MTTPAEAEFRKALEKAQRILSLLIRPDVVATGVSMITAYAQCVEAETEAREVLSRHPEPPTVGDDLYPDNRAAEFVREFMYSHFRPGEQQKQEVEPRAYERLIQMFAADADTIARLRERVVELEKEVEALQADRDSDDAIFDKLVEKAR